MTKIKYVVGDATEPEGDGPKYIVHCCNDMGLWGAGFVLALSKKWLKPETHYLAQNYFLLGTVFFVPVEADIVVCNLIGQDGVYRSTNLRPVRYDAIHDGLATVNAKAEMARASIHMPRMGAGLAGGSWRIIEAIVEAVCTVPVTVYDLQATPGTSYAIADGSTLQAADNACAFGTLPGTRECFRSGTRCTTHGMSWPMP